MNTKAVIFDKDGTLLDFDAFWLPVTDHVIRDILKDEPDKAVIAPRIWEAIGVIDGAARIDGALLSGTYARIGRIITGILNDHGSDRSEVEVTARVTEAFHRHYRSGSIVPACEGLAPLLTGLRSLGVKLAIVTTDDPFLTGKCLEALGIDKLFDRVYCDDGVLPPKPDPACITDFLGNFGLSASDAVMVGDTLTDMHFAKSGGIRAVGVAQNALNKSILKKEADAVIPDISHLPEVIP